MFIGAEKMVQKKKKRKRNNDIGNSRENIMQFHRGIIFFHCSVINLAIAFSYDSVALVLQIMSLSV